MTTVTTTTKTTAAAATLGTILPHSHPSCRDHDDLSPGRREEEERGTDGRRREDDGDDGITAATTRATAAADADETTMMIALYYCYTNLPLPPSPSPSPSDGDRGGGAVRRHVSFQKDLCASLNLFGRIRVSPEGINGVLSGRKCDLERYEDALREELLSSSQPSAPVGDSGVDGDEPATSTSEKGDGGHEVSSDQMLDLDVKYCHLRPDLDPEKQLFDSLSVKETAEVVSLHEPSGGGSRAIDQMGKKKNWRRRRRNRDRDRKEQTESGEKEEAKRKVFGPATHLSPEEWHASLLRASAAASSSSTASDGDNNADGAGGGGAVLLDARNVYESRVGHFSVPGVPTILTNTRKYSSLPEALRASAPHLAGRDVYMYCTGGVRCERASVYLREMMDGLKVDKGEGMMEGPRGVYQLRGGIQRYLEVYGRRPWEEGIPPAYEEGGVECEDVCEEEDPSMPSGTTPPGTLLEESADGGCVGNEVAAGGTLTLVDEQPPSPPVEEIEGGMGRSNDDEDRGDDDEDGAPSPSPSSTTTCLYVGKNFVFDPRRTDPVVGTRPSDTGRCLVCDVPHDDYDNGRAPAENREARCKRCRVLVLVCDDCRLRVRCWGEEEDEDEEEGDDDAVAMTMTSGRRRLDLFCGPGGAECIDEGNAVNVEVICEEKA